ncbi:MAG: cysteine--tRNA ligase [Clostridia bacterium]|nr:cysteine--tRNA ligase [Clostridia bacterium]
MQIFNTMTHKKEDFVPIHEGQVSMYVCGPTVYDFIHIGNARPLIVFDTFRRYLEYRGYQVTYVQNFTDIDDKLIRRANAENTTVPALAEKYIAEYYRDADALGIKRSSVNPRATEHIEDIIELVQTLIDKGHAYPTENGDVYFSVRSYPGYGKLKGQDINDMENGVRIDPNDIKKDPLDFALWKGAKPGEPSWPSPWGDGRPGWHIECSAMSMKILGPTFDIHGGGADLVFPHHENEIAQSEAATGKPFVHYWMHNGYINIDNQKMSKSLGNFFRVRDILKDYDPEAVRMFMLGANYRNPLNFSRDLMEQAVTSLTRLRTARKRLSETEVCEANTSAELENTLNDFRTRFNEAMDDDLNTADALGVLFDFARFVNIFATSSHSTKEIESVSKLYLELANILGLLIHDTAADDFPAEALALLEQRTAARKAKDWAKADAIRASLKEMGFAVEDSAQGPKLKKLS